MSLLVKARLFAEVHHKNQTRRDGTTPYFQHCQAIVDLLDTEEEKAIGYCHDIFEMTSTSFQDMAQAISATVANAVTKLTKMKNESYEQYIVRISRCSALVRKVKIADIIANLTDDPTKAQIIKYNKALNVLMRI